VIEHKRGAGRPSLVTNTVSNWIVLVINTVVGFVLTPVILHHIGKDGYGLWTLVSSVVGYYGLLRMGVGSAIMRYVSLNDGRRDPIAVNGTFSTAMGIYIAVAIVLVALSFAISRPLAGYFDQGDDFRVLLIYLGIAAALNCPSAVLEATLRSRERFVAANIVMTVVTLVRGVGLSAVLLAGYKLAAMAAVILVTSGVELVVMCMIFRIYCRDIRLGVSDISAAHIKSLLSFGIMAAVLSGAIMLRFQYDRIIIGKILSLETLGIYSVMATLLVNFRNIMRATSRVLNPRFSFLDGRGDVRSSTELFLRSSKMSAVLSSGICLLFMLAGPGFIRLWVGRGFESSYPLLMILSVAYMIGQSQTASTALLAGFGKQTILAVLTFAEAVLSIVLSIMLAKTYGLIGIAWGAAIPMLVFQGVVMPLYMCRYMEIPFISYYWQCLAGPWILTLSVLGVVNIFGAPVQVASWFELIAMCIVVGFAYGLLSYQILLDNSEKVLVVSRAAMMVKKA